jgi:putative addiction module antidote
MYALKIRPLGGSLGAILPKELLAELDVGENDTLFLTKAPDGFRLTVHNPEFERQMAVARRVMRKNRNVLRELAKR